jgi:hypothetical protein
MSPEEIRMCVLDVIQDDIENIAAVLRMLNSEFTDSWRGARGQSFTEVEVIVAMKELVRRGLVTPLAEMPPEYDLHPIDPLRIESEFDWSEFWFLIEPAGRQAIQNWWNTEGQMKYPTIDEADSGP